jgi:hypothetical protein
MKSRIVLAYVLAAFAASIGAQDRPDSPSSQSDRLDTLLRTGQYADARRLIDEMLALEPREDLKNARAVFANGPNMGVSRGAARFTCEASGTGVLLPLTVDGRRVTWLMDTGANISFISDAEAERIGLTIRDSDGRASDHAGGSAGVRTAVARRVVIGRTELRNVQFLVTPAEQMPWKELPPGKQGIVGLPLLIAQDALKWTRTGGCSTGLSAGSLGRSRGVPNLRYEGTHLVTKVESDGKVLDFILDTGNQAGTQLWERFGRDFAPFVKERGRKGIERVTQFGGAADREIVLLSAMRLRVGGRETHLAEGKLFSRPVGDDRFHGLLGMDVLSQASEVTIDFRSMRLALR